MIGQVVSLESTMTAYFDVVCRNNEVKNKHIDFYNWLQIQSLSRLY